MAERQILHLDMDAFFVSVERLYDRELEGRPVVVGAEDPLGRGVVAAASYEARRYGVRAGLPVRVAYRLCPEARFVAGHPEAYDEVSQAVRNMCRRVAPLVEMASLDEAYLDLSGTERLYASAGSVADDLQCRIARELGLPASFGWGENKLLAKVASSRSKPHGLLRVYPGRGRTFLAPLPLERLPGIGRKHAETLGRYGLRRIGELGILGERRLKECLGEAGRILYYRARGEDNSPVAPDRPEAQSIRREHTYETDTTDRTVIRATLSLLAERVAAALRMDGLRAGRIGVTLEYADARSGSRGQTLLSPTQDDREVYRTAAEALERLYTRRVRARKVGITASKLMSDMWRPLDLFEGDRMERLARLSQAIDTVRDRYGFRSVLRARSLVKGDGWGTPAV